AVVEWHMLYTKEPSPLVIGDLSESWWARTAWALLFNLFDDIPSISMIDGEKRGLDSSKRRNMGRAYIPEEPKHKKCGRKLDLICRDEVLRHDWLVVERMRGWGPQSTKFLREYSHDVVRETATIAHNRLFDVPTSFRKECTFVGAYTGNETRTRTLQPIGQYTLCPMNGELKEQFQGLVRLLQIRASMRNTIELYNSLIGSDTSTTEESPEYDDENLDWYYGEPEPRFDPNQVVSSSPIGPDDFSDLDELPSDANDISNTESEVQKEQGVKPDKPDIVVKLRNREVLYGEITGLFQEHDPPRSLSPILTLFWAVCRKRYPSGLTGLSAGEPKRVTMVTTPVYRGAIAILPNDVNCLAHFKSTKISEWSLENFAISTGLTKLEFLSGLKVISRTKRLPTEIQTFARGLTNYYDGVFGEEVTEIAKNNALKAVNRELLSSKEYLLLQKKVNTTIERDKYNLPDPFAGGYTTLSSSAPTLSRFAGKRTAAPTPQSSNKKRNVTTVDQAHGEDLDSDVTVDVNHETSHKLAGIEDKAVVGGDDDQDEEDGDSDNDGNEVDDGANDMIQELQELKRESESGFHPLIRALYHALCAGQGQIAPNLPLPKKRKYVHHDSCSNCTPIQAPGLEYVLSTLLIAAPLLRRNPKDLDEHLDEHKISLAREAADFTSDNNDDMVQAFKGDLIAHTGNAHTAEFLIAVTCPIALTLNDNSKITVLGVPNMSERLTGRQTLDAKEFQEPRQGINNQLSKPMDTELSQALRAHSYGRIVMDELHLYKKLDDDTCNQQFSTMAQDIAKKLSGALIQSKANVLLVLKPEAYGRTRSEDPHEQPLTFPLLESYIVESARHEG
ncbi:hypothetical protein BGX27_001995, partial [Mortierella sp. AM989]